MKTVTPYPQQMSNRFIVYDWAHAVGTELIEKLGFKESEETSGNILEAIKVFHENNILVMTKVGNDCMILCVDTPRGSFRQR